MKVSRHEIPDADVDIKKSDTVKDLVLSMAQSYMSVAEALGKESLAPMVMAFIDGKLWGYKVEERDEHDNVFFELVGQEILQFGKPKWIIATAAVGLESEKRTARVIWAEDSKERAIATVAGKGSGVTEDDAEWIQEASVNFVTETVKRMSILFLDETPNLH